MELPAWVFIVENIAFWSIVIYIALMKKETPSWAFVVLLLFVIWFGIRLLLSLAKMDRLFAINLINQVIILLLFYKLGRRRE